MNIQEVLKLHKQWLNQEECGCRAILCDADLRNADLYGADLCGADLRNTNLRNADLRGADLYGADLRIADLRDADLRGADLRNADLCNADLRGADLGGADLSGADLSGADLRVADLRDADLRGADMHDANLSNAQNIENQNSADYISAHFDKTEDGIIVYKTFNNHQQPNPNWIIEEGSVIEENVNYNRTNDCGCGVNVATLDWIKKHGGQGRDIWECLIKWEWLSDVVGPYHTDGKIRAGRVQLVRVVGVV